MVLWTRWMNTVHRCAAMKDPILLHHKHPLSPEQARYWKDLLYRVTKVGTELEVAPPRGMRRPEFETLVRRRLEPSNAFSFLGKLGVLDVQTEHCGIEIRVIGRHPDFWALQQQYQQIIGHLLALGARPKATCGLHFHLLAPDLAEPVPEVILANLWNLTRRYAPELKFLTSGGNRPDGLCRRRNHNSHLEMVHHSPVMTTMEEIQQALQTSRTVPPHQNFLNLEHLGFTPTGDVLPFHIEFRFPDADLCPTSVTAKTFLFMALLLKAVDLSQYGVIHVGKIDPWRHKVAMLNLLSNNDGTLASSDTSGVTPDIMVDLRQGLEELLELLKPIFCRFIDRAALTALYQLAEQPISLRRCLGQDWDAMEQALRQALPYPETSFDEVDQDLMQHIELGEWCRFTCLETWQRNAAGELAISLANLQQRLRRLEHLRGLSWDPHQGAVVFMS
jgi:hypothetical protein